MQIKYLGHASFLITAENGTRIITDPYQDPDKLGFGKIQEQADVLTISHDHFDHNNEKVSRGNPAILKKAGPSEAKGIKFQGTACYHDEEKGKARGNNIIFCFEVDGMRICHLGDLGHQLSDAQVNELGKIDVLLIPVGGLYTIDAKGATQLSDKLKPKVLIPMHFKSVKPGLPIASVDGFIQGKKNVKKMDASALELKPAQLPSPTQIIVLKPAL